MFKVIKLSLAMLLVFGAMGVAISVYAQETEQPAVSSATGKIISIDLEKSIVVLNEIKDAAAGIAVPKTISVLPETTITKGEDILTISDLEVGDKITVEFTIDDLGKEIVESITVETEEPAL